MKALTRVLCIALLLIVPTALFAQDRDYRGSGITGKVLGIDNGDKTLEVYDSSHRHYTVLAGDAKIYDGGRERRLGDIRKDDLVRVYGRERGDFRIVASRIDRLDRDDYRRGDYEERMEVRGIIKSVHKKDNRLDIRTRSQQNLKVRITRDTDIYSKRGRTSDPDYLRPGDDVIVEGYRVKNNEIVALTIHTGDQWDDRRERRDDRMDNRYDRNVEVRVIKDTSIIDRKLKVEPLNDKGRLPDQFTMDVPKDADVTRNGRRISVHEINEGDILRAEGTWRGSIFVAPKIRVESRRYDDRYDRDDRVFTGKISRIDYAREEFTLDGPGRDIKVHADRARVFRNGRFGDFNDLRKGDEVRVRGDVSGDRLDAAHIETTR